MRNQLRNLDQKPAVTNPNSPDAYRRPGGAVSCDELSDVTSECNRGGKGAHAEGKPGSPPREAADAAEGLSRTHEGRRKAIARGYRPGAARRGAFRLSGG